jgi:hypothetical protein
MKAPSQQEADASGGKPTGKITLRLLEWVTAEEAGQNKRRGIEETPQRRKGPLKSIRL